MEKTLTLASHSRLALCPARNGRSPAKPAKPRGIAIGARLAVTFAMRTSTCLSVFTLSVLSAVPAYAGSHGGTSSSSSSSGGSHSSSSSGSSSGSSHSSSSSSSSSRSSSSSAPSHSAASSSGGSHSSSGGSHGSWGGYGGTIRDHRTGGGGGSGRPISSGGGSGGITVNGGHGGGGPTVRDHRHGDDSTGGETVVVEDGGNDFSIADSGYAYDCCSTYDAVGYRAEPYGAWGRGSAMPHVALELGTGMRTFGDPLSASLRGPGGSDRAVTTQLRFLVHMRGALYIGAEGELGGLVSQVPTDPSMMQNSAMVMGGAGLVGAMSRQGNAAFGVELAAGGRSVVYQFAGLDEPTSTSIGTAVLEPRARAQYWVTPFIALGAQAGANVVSHGDWMAGAFLSIHTRAFGSD
jgi:hypothetical protein